METQINDVYHKKYKIARNLRYGLDSFLFDCCTSVPLTLSQQKQSRLLCHACSSVNFGCSQNIKTDRDAGTKVGQKEAMQTARATLVL